MIRISYPATAAAAAKGADALLIVAPQSCWTTTAFPRGAADAKSKKLLVDLATDAKPGRLGAVASTIGGSEVRRLLAGVLPDDVSRYNAPSRSVEINRVVAGAGLDKHAKAGLVLVLDSADHAAAALNAAARAFPLFSAKTNEPSSLRLAVVCVDRKGKVLPLDATAKETAEAARHAARLVDTPPTVMNPEAMAGEVKKLVAGIKHVKVKVIVGPALLRAGLGGLHAVGRTAVKAPRMLVATYAPPRSKGRHVALVGKGVTFDTGGLHIKGRGFMEGMKCDMGGAAAVTGAFMVLAKSRIKRRISLVVCLAENAVGPESYKPDDVITMHSGKTVEINNTDAEGRLLLADGVSYASRVLKAGVVLNAATLTGAQMIATGSNHAAVVSNDADIESALVAAGRASGDLVHPLPFAPEFYKTEFKSMVADMKNSVKNRLNAQSSCAAQFVYNHIEDTETLWGHVDLAGPAFRSERGTGFGVALLSEAVSQID